MVLDSVINSVTTLEFVDAVFTCVNALCAADGTLFTNARSLEATRTARRTTKNTGDARRIEFFELPKTISGKIRRVELRAREAARVQSGDESGQHRDRDYR